MLCHIDLRLTLWRHYLTFFLILTFAPRTDGFKTKNIDKCCFFILNLIIINLDKNCINYELVNFKHDMTY